MRRYRNDLVGLLVLTAALLGGLPVRASGGEDESLPRLVLIRPGTPVGKTPPAGWSDLVVKSLPRIESGEVESLPSIGAATAALFRTIFLADVRRANGPGTPYVLKRIGVGLCVPVDGVDTVVDEENADAPPFSLGFVESQVLSRGQAELKKSRLIARTETSAVMAAPTELKVGSVHKKVFLHYALLADPATGRLDTWVWAVSARADRRTPPASVTHLPPHLTYQCGLDVSANRLLGALPVSWSFAMGSLPPGRPVTTPEPLRPWLGDPHKIAAQPSDFERLIRGAFKNAPEAAEPPGPSR